MTYTTSPSPLPLSLSFLLILACYIPFCLLTGSPRQQSPLRRIKKIQSNCVTLFLITLQFVLLHTGTYFSLELCVVFFYPYLAKVKVVKSPPSFSPYCSLCATYQKPWPCIAYGFVKTFYCYSFDMTKSQTLQKNPSDYYCPELHFK